MPQIILADNHEQVYPVWQERKLQNITLTHLDFHCDMRGIMIDRKKGSAFFISERETTFIDRGNFLAHAIMGGIVSDLRWIHGPRGGRAYDVGPVVSYETDYLAPLHRYNHNRSGRKEVEFKFEESLLSDWQGIRKGEILDIDWDAFASVEYDAAHRDELVAEFFNREFPIVPALTTLIFSPGYSDPDRSLYSAFAERLAETFKAEIIELPKARLNREGESNSVLKKLIKRYAPSQVLDLKRTLSRKWRKLESAKDLEHFDNAA